VSVAASHDPVPQTLSRAVGIDLEGYRPQHVDERIRRALERERVPTVARLTRLLVADPDARARFRRSIAVSVSGLFRDPEQFDLIERDVLPELLPLRRLSVCSVGCSNGSELYSIALLLEAAGALDRSFLLGCDLLEENLEAARRGVYSDVAVPMSVRNHARWEQRDVLGQGVPPGKWRLVLCRNLAIYLAPPAKQRLHEALAAALGSGGFLVLGRSERLANPRTLGLEPFSAHIYRSTS